MRNNDLIKFPFEYENKAIAFHESTDIEEFIKEKKGVKAHDKFAKTQYKGYPRFNTIKLPNPSKLTENLDTVLFERKSTRIFSSNPVSIEDLSTLLYYSAGIKDYSRDTENRFYPSAGSKYPLEVYIIVQNCSGLKKGIYHYHVKTHSLEFLWNFSKEDIEKNFKHEWVKDSPLVLVITGIFYRNMIKYRERGYRHVLMESGIITQNFYLTATAIKMGCCSMGGFIDKGLGDLLDINNFEEKVLTCIASGYRLKGGE